MILAIMLFADALNQFGEIPGLISSLLRDFFIINGGWILPNVFSVFIEMVISTDVWYDEWHELIVECWTSST